MSYLDIIRKLEEELSGGGKPLPEAGKVTSEAGTQCEKSELSEKSAPAAAEPRPSNFLEHRSNAVDCLVDVSLPGRRCQACHSYLFWVSVYGVVTCASCHPPATPQLVREWFWLPEGECKRTQ